MVELFCDGGARGNPGPAAVGVVAHRDGKPLFEIARRIGQATNNVAEYQALIAAFEELGCRSIERETVTVCLDSELVVKQMKGEYRVRNAGLKPLYERALLLSKKQKQVTYKHVHRFYNAAADELVNRALDGKE